MVITEILRIIEIWDRSIKSESDQTDEMCGMSFYEFFKEYN